MVACYIPPNYPSVRANACLDYIADVVAKAKRQIDSPMIIIGGDFNQWLIKPVIDKHSDLREVEHDPTRGERKIDKFLVNLPQSVTESDTLPHLTTARAERAATWWYSSRLPSPSSGLRLSVIGIVISLTKVLRPGLPSTTLKGFLGTIMSTTS